jgi:hypothetical protein
MPLTELEIKNAKPREKPYKLTDGGWLFLLVNPNGSKLWRLSYRFSSKQKLLALGTYPGMGLKDARTKRDEARAMLADGIDPGEQRRLTKLTRETQTATTFKLIAAEYRDKLKREGRATATMDKLDWLLALVEPKLGGRPISEITSPEVLAALKPVEARGNLETARRLRSTIGSVFRYAIATARATNDPTVALKGALVAPKATPGGDHRALGAGNAPAGVGRV